MNAVAPPATGPFQGCAAGLPWLVRLRFAAMGGLVATALVMHAAFQLVVPLGPLAAVIAVVLASNAALLVWRQAAARHARAVLAAALFADAVLVTVLLYYTGGPTNPFTAVYFIHVVLAAVLLGPGWTWAMVALTTAGFGLLFVDHVPLQGPLASSGCMGFSFHLYGMLAAYGLSAACIGYFVDRVMAAMRRRESELASAQARQERFAALTALAAGAAHELATPLGTIALAARELERTAERTSPGAALADDARLIRTEVERCRGVLDQLHLRAEAAGEDRPEAVAAGELLADVAAQAPGRVQVAGSGAAAVVVVPRRAVAQALRALVKNALDASAPGMPVQVQAECAAATVRFTVRDRGCGMAADALARVGEPFYTTKPPGAGLGLGVFLVRLLAERLHGRLEFESQPGRGTAVTFEVPQAAGAGA